MSKSCTPTVGRLKQVLHLQMILEEPTRIESFSHLTFDNEELLAPAANQFIHAFLSAGKEGQSSQLSDDSDAFTDCACCPTVSLVVLAETGDIGSPS